MIKHIKTAIHQENLKKMKYATNKQQTLMQSSQTEQKQFYFSSCIFFLNPVPSDKILLMLSDAYMLKAYLNLKKFYEDLIHCTGLTHGLNRVAETI